MQTLGFENHSPIGPSTQSVKSSCSRENQLTWLRRQRRVRGAVTDELFKLELLERLRLSVISRSELYVRWFLLVGFAASPLPLSTNTLGEHLLILPLSYGCQRFLKAFLGEGGGEKNQKTSAENCQLWSDETIFTLNQLFNAEEISRSYSVHSHIRVFNSLNVWGPYVLSNPFYPLVFMSSTHYWRIRW